MNKDITNYSFEQLVRQALSFAIEKCRDIANPQDELLLKHLEKVSNSPLRVLPEKLAELLAINRAIEIYLAFASAYGGESDPFFSAENERLFQTEKIRQLRGIQQQVVQKLGNYEASADDLNHYLYPPATPISSQPAAPQVLSSQPAVAKAKRPTADKIVASHKAEIALAEKTKFGGDKTKWFSDFAKRHGYTQAGNTLEIEWNRMSKKSSAKRVGK